MLTAIFVWILELLKSKIKSLSSLHDFRIQLQCLIIILFYSPFVFFSTWWFWLHLVVFTGFFPGTETRPLTQVSTFFYTVEQGSDVFLFFGIMQAQNPHDKMHITPNGSTLFHCCENIHRSAKNINMDARSVWEPGRLRNRLIPCALGPRVISEQLFWCVGECCCHKGLWLVCRGAVGGWYLSKNHRINARNHGLHAERYLFHLSMVLMLCLIGGALKKVAFVLFCGGMPCIFAGALMLSIFYVQSVVWIYWSENLISFHCATCLRSEPPCTASHWSTDSTRAINHHGCDRWACARVNEIKTTSGTTLTTLSLSVSWFL